MPSGLADSVDRGGGKDLSGGKDRGGGNSGGKSGGSCSSKLGTFELSNQVVQSTLFDHDQ